MCVILPDVTECLFVCCLDILSGEKNIPCHYQDERRSQERRMGLFSFPDTRGPPPSHPQIDQSLLWVYLWLERIQPATEVAGEERKKIMCAAATAALQIVQGHQSSALNPIRQRNGWVDICCVTPVLCAVKSRSKATTEKEEGREDGRKEGRREGWDGRK